MKSIKKKSQHKSNWKTIFVIENDDLSIYELNDKGRLSDCFSKQKYRNIRFCYEKLILDSIKKQKKKKQSQPDQKFSKEVEALFNISLDENEDEMNLLDELDSFNYFESSKK